MIPAETSLLLRTLCDRPISFLPALARVAGSATAGLFLSQACYWSPRTSNPDGWFYKTRAEWTSETCLTRSEQENARRQLRALGILEEKRCDIPAKLYFRVRWDVLFSALSCRQDSASKMVISCQQDGHFLPSISEITAEITAEKEEYLCAAAHKLVAHGDCAPDATAPALQPAEAAPPGLPGEKTNGTDPPTSSAPTLITFPPSTSVGSSRARPSSTQESGSARRVQPLSEEDWPGLRATLEAFEFPMGQLDDNAWWNSLTWTCNNPSLDWLSTEFARCCAWLAENPARQPRTQWKRFLRRWLERAYEQQRRMSHA